MIRICYWHSLLVGFLFWAIYRSVAPAAGPDTDNPQAFLTPWTDEQTSENATKLYSDAVSLYPICLEQIEKYETALTGGKEKSLKLLQVGGTLFLIQRLGEFGKRLSAWGEPAGRDAERRSLDLIRRFNPVQTALMNTFNKEIQRGLPLLKARATKNMKLLASTKKLLGEGKAAAAEKQFLPVYADLTAMGCWYLDPRRGAMGEFDDAYLAIVGELDRLNAEDAQKLVSELSTKTRPDLNQFAEALKDVALDKNGTAEWNGKQLSGPKLINAVVESYERLQRQTLRAAAVDWAATETNSERTRDTELVTQCAQLEQGIVTAFVQVIETDGARVPESEAAGLHAAYIGSISRLAAKTRDPEIIAPLEKALRAIEAKSSTLSADVAAYHGATDEYLKWLRRAAESAARSQKPDKAMSLSAIELSRGLDSAAPVLVERISKSFLGHEVRVASECLGSLKHKQTGSAVLENALIRLPPTPNGIEGELRADLLISKENPPLTIAAGRALLSGMSGNYREIVGKVKRIELVGATPFLANESPERELAFGIGGVEHLHAIASGIPSLRVFVILDIDPAWVRAEYLYAEFK